MDPGFFEEGGWGVDPGFFKGGANSNAWPHGCSKGEGAMEAFAMCA